MFSSLERLCVELWTVNYEPCLVNDGVMSNKVYSASHKLWMKLSVCVFNSYSECCQFFHST